MSSKEYYKRNAEKIKAKSLEYYYTVGREKRQNDKVDVKCTVCEELFLMKRLSAKASNRYYCSTKCRSIGYKELIGGDKSHLWKGGITPTHNKVRQMPEYNQWVQDVFKKDNYICQYCGCKGGKLTAHHVENFASLYPTLDDLLWEVENGITFCIDCHKEFHSQFGIKNNDMKQIKEFLGHVA